MNPLIDLLCCPESGQALQPAPADLIERLQASAKAGTLKNRSGEVPEAFEAALVTQDGSRIYPVRDGIPALLVQEIL